MARVAAPTLPSATRGLWACWKALTAAVVLAPYLPSMVPGSWPAALSQRCSSWTSTPVAPGRSTLPVAEASEAKPACWVMARMAARVAVPATPSSARPWSCWKARTAWWVRLPNLPSIAPTG